jgi:hypothetical protein
MDKKKISKTIESRIQNPMVNIVAKDQTSKKDQAKGSKLNPIINSPSRPKR